MSVGQPGEPGQPGESGAGGGGTGGHGGTGGAGGAGGSDPHARRLMVTIVFVVVVAVGLSVGTLLIAQDARNASSAAEANSDAIRALEQSDNRQTLQNERALHRVDLQHDESLKLIRQTDYRLCVRQQVVRAAINLDRGHDEPNLKLYDCTPDLTGGVATSATPAQAAALKRAVRNGTAP